MNSTADFWTHDQNVEWLHAPAGATLLLVSSYPTGWVGASDRIESLDFTSMGWTQHYNFPLMEEDVVAGHLKVVSRVLTEPIGVNSPPFRAAVNPGGRQPDGFGPAGGYAMFVFNGFNDVQASMSNLVAWLPPPPPLEAIDAPEGGFGILLAFMQDQGDVYGGPAMTELPDSWWTRPPYERMAVRAFVEPGLPGGLYHRDWQEWYGPTQKVLLVVS